MREIILFAFLLILVGCNSNVNDIDSNVNDIKCTVKLGSQSEYCKYYKIIFLDLNWENYDDFSVNEITIQYGSGQSTPETSAQQSKVVLSSPNEILARFSFNDPRSIVAYCEQGGHCPEPEFLKSGTDLLILNYFPNTQTIKIYEANNPSLSNSVIARYLPEGYTLDGKKLISLDISDCFKRFCEEIADPDDPDCECVRQKCTEDPINKKLDTENDDTYTPVEPIYKRIKEAHGCN